MSTTSDSPADSLLVAAIRETLDERFPVQKLPGSEGHQEPITYKINDLALLNLILRRHQGQDDRNQDPDVCSRVENEVSSSKPGHIRVHLVKTPLPNHGNRPPPPSVPSPVASTSGSSALSTAGVVRPGPHPAVSSNRNTRRRTKSLANPYRKAEIVMATSGVDIRDKKNLSTTGWMGINKGSAYDGKTLVEKWENDEIFADLVGMSRIPYAGVKTRFLDQEGRMFMLRSFVSDEDVKSLVPAFTAQVEAFADEIEERGTGFSEKIIADNARGNHFFSIMGHDRNLKGVPALSKWHRNNEDLIEKLLEPGTPVSIVINKMTGIFKKEFPGLMRRSNRCAEELDIQPMFGPFYQFCINARRKSRKRKKKKKKTNKDVVGVHCGPHGDWKNLAIFLCCIFIYGSFDSKQKAWLVIWEAGLIIELPAGVFLYYPSAIFFHFNIDLSDLQDYIVVTNGEQPTPQNSTPLGHGEGRGSCVFFSQASMFQTAELGVPTVAEARRRGMDATSDAQELIRRGMFPKQL